MPITPKFTLERCRLCSKIKDPAGDEAAHDGNIGHNDGDVVLDVIDAKIDRVGPIRFEKGEEAVAIRQVDFGRTDGCNAGGLLEACGVC